MKENNKLAIESLTGTIIQVSTDLGKEFGAEAIKKVVEDQGLNLLANIAMDTGLSFIPALGNAISSYKINKEISNLKILIEELNSKTYVIEENLKNISKEKLEFMDNVSVLMVEKAANTSQEEKIKYFVNGFIICSFHEKLSYDITYLYFDIAVLRIYTNTYKDESKKLYGYSDVIDEFNIENEQYLAVRKNLEINGLIETNTDINITNDIDKLKDEINKIQKFISEYLKVINGKSKKIPNYKSQQIKINSNDRYKISKFGREFYNFFITKD